ncbi:MAG: deoxyribose-phosphate aldolase [Erysipelothrix sp.]|nr:deoxyribose-phosphate aldolase [Erysipelothrix sp.]
MNKYIDHTMLAATATEEDIKKLCNEAIEYNFKAVCVNPTNVALAKQLLEGTDILVCTVVGFPLGANTTATKVFEVKDAIANGAEEIDMVINSGKFKDKDYAYVIEEIKALKAACGDVTLKVIVETAYLDDAEILKVSECVKEAKADFIKTSTGFASRGATIKDVELMKSVVKDDVLIKAAGGVRTPEDLEKIVAAGANRIGTSSGVKLVSGNKAEGGY